MAYPSTTWVTTGADGRLEVFVVGDDLQPDGLGSGGALHTTSQTTRDGRLVHWRSYPTGGPNLCGLPAVVRSADADLEVLVVGNDGRLWQMWQSASNGDWSGWRPHDAPSGMKFLRLRPAVASGLDGRLKLFLVADDASLWQLRLTGSNEALSQWFSHGAPAGTSLLAAITTG